MIHLVIERGFLNSKMQLAINLQVLAIYNDEFLLRKIYFAEGPQCHRHE